MTTKERVEFRVDESIKRLLEDMARSRGVSLGELLRSFVAEQLAKLGWNATSRSQAAQDLLNTSVGPLPEPDQLQREISDAFTTDE